MGRGLSCDGPRGGGDRGGDRLGQAGGSFPLLAGGVFPWDGGEGKGWGAEPGANDLGHAWARAVGRAGVVAPAGELMPPAGFTGAAYAVLRRPATRRVQWPRGRSRLDPSARPRLARRGPDRFTPMGHALRALCRSHDRKAFARPTAPWHPIFVERAQFSRSERQHDPHPNRPQIERWPLTISIFALSSSRDALEQIGIFTCRASFSVMRRCWMKSPRLRRRTSDDTERLTADELARMRHGGMA